MDDLGLVETIDRFRESAVITVSNAADGRFNARFCQPDTSNYLPAVRNL